MKIFRLIKDFKIKKLDSNYTHKYSLTINDREIEKVKVIVNKLSGDTYKLLCKFVSPRYDTVYLMRHKKSFTTSFFKQHYDVIVCDKNFRVIKTFTDLDTGFVSEYFSQGYFIYFATVGTINFNNIRSNDRVRIMRNWIKF